MKPFARQTGQWNQPVFLTTPGYSLGLPEGRGFSPAETASTTLCPSRAPRSLRPQAARGAGLGTRK